MPFPSYIDLYLAVSKLRKQANDRGEPLFMNTVPEEWFEPKTRYRCKNDHVSSHYIELEASGGSRCPACMEYVCITFPDDVDGTPLPDTLPEYELTWDGT
jgi:hypothetical protein